MLFESCVRWEAGTEPAVHAENKVNYFSMSNERILLAYWIELKHILRNILCLNKDNFFFNFSVQTKWIFLGKSNSDLTFYILFLSEKNRVIIPHERKIYIYETVEIISF
jgi:hypothetical protein